MLGKREPSLLPEEENADTITAKILRYLTTVGRVIIILTELIVISAFISRFWLDRRNSDLSEIVRQQKAILATTVEFEKEYSLLQQRLKVVKKLLSENPDFFGPINALVKSTPPEIVYDNLNLKDTTDQSAPPIATLNLYSYREDSLVEFISNLMVNPTIKSVSVNKIEKKVRDTRYLVNLTIEFTPPKK